MTKKRKQREHIIVTHVPIKGKTAEEVISALSSKQLENMLRVEEKVRKVLREDPEREVGFEVETSYTRQNESLVEGGFRYRLSRSRRDPRKRIERVRAEVKKERESRD